MFVFKFSNMNAKTGAAIVFLQGILAREEQELAKLVGRLDKASTAYGMEISAEKTKLLTIKSSGINTYINVN